MKPYGNAHRGTSGCRKSKDTPHRRRCLRTDKKRERQKKLESTDDLEPTDLELATFGLALLCSKVRMSK